MSVYKTDKLELEDKSLIISSLLDFYSIVVKAQPTDLNKIFTESVSIEVKGDDWSFVRDRKVNIDKQRNRDLDQADNDVEKTEALDTTQPDNSDKFQVSLVNMLNCLLKMPDENIQDQVLKMISSFCDPILEIREHFCGLMVDCVIPEICTNYCEYGIIKDTDDAKNSFLKQSDSVGVNYFIKTFEL